MKAHARHTTILRHNRVRDRGGLGIDLDDGSSNYHIYNNLCLGVPIHLREGDYRTVENNIIIHPSTPPDFHVGYENNSDSFRRNIIAVSSKELNPNWNPEGGGDIYKLIFPPPKGKWIGDVDYNVLFNDVGKFSVTVAPRGQKRWWAGGDRYTLEEWRKLGYDLHSVFADPMFVDPANGDYRVKPESPALKMGFKNFEMDQFGLLPEFPNQWQDR